MIKKIQGLTHAGRTFDLTDELANILGFIPGWVAWKIVSKFNV